MATVDKPNEYKVIGTRPIRHDGADKVTGRALYGADIRLPGMLYGAVLRSPHAHAQIISIDTCAAEKLPGVQAVVTAKDLPDLENKIVELGEGSRQPAHQATTCWRATRCCTTGTPWPPSPPTSPHVAEEALKLIKVEYEVLPSGHWMCATRWSRTRRFCTTICAPMSWARKATSPATSPGITKMNAAMSTKDLQEATFIVEREFKTASVHQGYIEPHMATALWNTDGHVTIWCSTQGSFSVREQVAEILANPGLARSGHPDGDRRRLRRQDRRLSGAGGRAALAQKRIPAGQDDDEPRRSVDGDRTRRRVRTSRSSWARMRTGKLTAAEAYLAYEAGAYPGAPVGPGMGVHRCDRIASKMRGRWLRCRGQQAAHAAYRAPGATQAAFAAKR